MALTAHQRRRRYLTSEALPAGFAPETGAPMARLWVLRLPPWPTRRRCSKCCKQNAR